MRYLAAVVVASCLAAAPARGAAPALVESFEVAWRTVRDTHFDTTFGGQDWDAVRAELLPRAERARDASGLRAVIDTMLARLGASHFVVLPGSYADSLGGTGGGADPGVEVRFLDGAPVVVRVETGSPADEAGVRPGWRMVAVEGEPVETILARVPGGLAPGRRLLERWSLLERFLRGSAGSAVPVAFLDGAGRRRELTLTRVREPGTPVRLGYFPPLTSRLEEHRLDLPGGKTVGVIRFSTWMVPAARELDRAVERLRNADGIVVDLRGNPGGLAGMIMGVAGHFLDRPVLLGTIRSRDQELHLTANPRTVTAEGRPVRPYRGPLAILVDELSFSASEFFAGAMQAVGRARIFGRPTLGWALGATFTRLPDGDLLEYAVFDFVLPDGRRLEGNGVVPDVVTPLRRRDLLAGRDAALDAALEWIREGGEP